MLYRDVVFSHPRAQKEKEGQARYRIRDLTCRMLFVI